jgi:hypothetical protein
MQPPCLTGVWIRCRLRIEQTDYSAMTGWLVLITESGFEEIQQRFKHQVVAGACGEARGGMVMPVGAKQ